MGGNDVHRMESPMILPSEMTSVLEKKALTDLINRTMISSFVYPIFWISIGLSNEIYKTHRELLFLNFAFASLLTIIRTSFVFSLKQIIDRHYKTITLLFVITVLVQGFHFSCLTIYIYFTEDLQSLIIPMVVSSGGILAAGATTLGINRIIRFLFPITFIFPMVAALMWHFNPMNLRISVILIISFSYLILISKRVYQDYWRAITNETLLEHKAIELEGKIKEIETLSGLLPICSSCKKIRDDKGYWNQIESYIEKHSSAQFSHSICDECTEKLYGDETWYKDMMNEKK